MKADEIPVSRALTTDSELSDMFPAGAPLQSKAIYIPIYSNLLYFDKNHPVPLQASVSLRNTDRDEAVQITDITYYDTNGEKIRSYLQKPIGLKPLASYEIYIGTSDLKGGSGAKFIVRWTAEIDISPPLFEAVFMGRRGNSDFTFASRGVEAR